MSNEITTHPFTRSGMGAGPFKFVSAVSMPSPPDASTFGAIERYNAAMHNLPKLIGGCGTCYHCGMAIRNICVVENERGERFGVGSTCVIKCEPRYARPVKAKVSRAVERRKRREWEATPAGQKEMARRAAERAGYLAQVERERAERESAEAARMAEVGDIVARLERLGGDFYGSLARQLRGGNLSHRQAECALKGLSATGRRNKKNAAWWDDTYYRMVGE